MKKFVVRTETFEFNPTKYATVQDAYWAGDDHLDEVVALCDTIEEARAILAKQPVATHHYSRKLAAATIAFIESSEWEQDDDGQWEFVDGMDIWEFKCE